MADTSLKIKSREEIVEDLIRQELGPSAHGDNHDLYDRRLTSTSHPEFKYVPYCIYFYYVRLDDSGKVRIDHYFYTKGPRKNPSRWQPIAYHNVPKILKKLALNGRPSVKKKKPPRSFGDTFEDVVWNRRAYVGIFFDEANWTFHRRSNGKAAVVCNVSSNAQPNGSFFDAQDLVFMMPNKKTGKKDKRSAIFFVNHMKYNDGGNPCDIGEIELNYKFDFYMKAKYSKTDYTVMTVILDPGGTNQGPPQQP